MKIYAVFNESGIPTAFYTDDIHKTIPAGAVEITQEQWWGYLLCPYTPVLTDSEQAAQIRAQRDRLIAATDYLVMPDYPLSEALLTAVKEYRQALRDITAQSTFPQSVSWPDKPTI